MTTPTISAKTGPRVENQAGARPIATGDKPMEFEIENGKHVKKGVPIWTVKPNMPLDRLDARSRDCLMAKARSNGGYYSTFGPKEQHGFLFFEQDKASKFAGKPSSQVEMAGGSSERQQMPPSLASVPLLLQAVSKDLKLLAESNPRATQTRQLAEGIADACEQIKRRCMSHAGLDRDTEGAPRQTSPAVREIQAKQGSLILVDPTLAPEARLAVVKQHLATSQQATSSQAEKGIPVPTTTPASAPITEAPVMAAPAVAPAPAAMATATQQSGPSHVLVSARKGEDFAAVAKRLGEGSPLGYKGLAVPLMDKSAGGQLEAGSRIMVITPSGQTLGHLAWKETRETGDNKWALFADPATATTLPGKTIVPPTTSPHGVVVVGPQMTSKSIDSQLLPEWSAARKRSWEGVAEALKPVDPPGN